MKHATASARRQRPKEIRPSKRKLPLRLGLYSLVLIGLIATAQAQQPQRIFRIGILAYDQNRTVLEPLYDELNRLGYVADRTAKIELWNAEGRAEKLAELAEEAARFKPDVVVASATPPALAAKKALPNTPIVFTQVADPVGSGMVASFTNPGGNLTGVTNMNVELSGKRTELLMETFPATKRIGLLTNPADPISAPQLKEMTRAVEAAKRRAEVINAREPKDFDELAAVIRKHRVDAISLVSSQLFAGHRAKVIDAAVATKTPFIYWNGTFVSAGALMAYGVNATDLYKRAAFYVDKILKGAAPAELPVEQPRLFELHINLKTAKQMGVTVPPSVLWRADKVIQ